MQSKGIKPQITGKGVEYYEENNDKVEFVSEKMGVEDRSKSPMDIEKYIGNLVNSSRDDI